MGTFVGRRKPLIILLVLLIVSIILDRYLIAPLCPWVSSIGGMAPMIVFLDIPLPLPIIDPLPVAALFSGFYYILLISDHTRYRGDFSQRMTGLFTGIFILLACMGVSAYCWHLLGSYLPKEVRNGVESFGVQMDLYTPVPGFEIIRFRGSAVLLVAVLIGSRCLLKKANRKLAEPPIASSTTVPSPTTAPSSATTPSSTTSSPKPPPATPPPTAKPVITKPVPAMARPIQVYIVAPRAVQIIRK